MFTNLSEKKSCVFFTMQPGTKPKPIIIGLGVLTGMALVVYFLRLPPVACFSSCSDWFIALLCIAID